MKLYLVYAKLSLRELEKMKSNLPNVESYHKMKDSDTYIGLYGLSADKDIVDEFISSRPLTSRYVVKKKHIEKEEYAKIKVDYKLYLIDKYSFRESSNVEESDVKTFNMISTFNEFVECQNNVFENIERFMDNFVDFNLFDADVIKL